MKERAAKEDIPCILCHEPALCEAKGCAFNNRGCTHPQMTGVWPRNMSPPQRVCFACGFSRPMTAEEIVEAMRAGE